MKETNDYVTFTPHDEVIGKYHNPVIIRKIKINNGCFYKSATVWVESKTGREFIIRCPYWDVASALEKVKEEVPFQADLIYDPRMNWVLVNFRELA